MKRTAIIGVVWGTAMALLIPFWGGVFGLGSAEAVAQQRNSADKTSPPAAKQRVKTYDFSGDDIDGDLIRPDGDFLDTRRFAAHTSLIRIRADFIREIVKSAEDL